MVARDRQANGHAAAVLKIPEAHEMVTKYTVLDNDTQHQILKYFTIYSFITIGLLFVVSLDNNNFMTVVSAVFSCFNNIGPMIGTGQTFSIFSPISKLLLSLAMIAGRLEIYPMILLFLPKTWSKR